MIGRPTYKDIQGITIKRKVGSNDESEMMSQFSRSFPILNGNKTLLQRWINVNDVDSTSQQRRMRSGCRVIYQFMTAIHYRSTTARVRYGMIYRSHNKTTVGSVRIHLPISRYCWTLGYPYLPHFAAMTTA